jgi:hypothetical protein
MFERAKLRFKRHSHSNSLHILKNTEELIIVIFKEMSHWGIRKVQNNVTYYLNGPLFEKVQKSAALTLVPICTALR